MIIRRFVASVCALSLAAPAAAVASPGTHLPKPQGPYGVIAATGPPVAAEPKGPYGVTPAGPVVTAKAKGPYGVTPAAGPVLTAKAKGPYGVTPATGAPVTAGRTANAAAAATRSNATAGWRVAAISEGALLAALGLGLAGLASVRRREPRTAT